MALIRAFLNNGFFFLVLIVAVTLYLVYSENIKRDHGIVNAHSSDALVESADADVPKILPNKPEVTPEVIPEQLTETTVPNSEDSVKNESTAIEVVINEPPQEVIIVEEPISVETIAEVTEEVIKAPLEETVVETLENDSEVADNKVVEEAVEAIEAISKPVSESAQSNDNLAVEVNDDANSVPDADLQKTVASKSQQASPMNLPASDEDKLNAILNDSALAKNVPQFANAEAAYSAARQAFYNKEFDTAEKIYFSMVQKNPTANALGELGNVLYMNKKSDLANRAWLESAKFLIKEQRTADAFTLANRLRPVAPHTAQKIAYQLSKMMANQYTQKQMQNTPQTPSTMPAMKPYRSQPMPAMPTMQPPIKDMAPMKPMVPMTKPAYTHQPMVAPVPMQPYQPHTYPTQTYAVPPMQGQPARMQPPIGSMNYSPMPPLTPINKAPQTN